MTKLTDEGIQKRKALNKKIMVIFSAPLLLILLLLMLASPDGNQQTSNIERINGLLNGNNDDWASASALDRGNLAEYVAKGLSSQSKIDVSELQNRAYDIVACLNAAYKKMTVKVEVAETATLCATMISRPQK